MRLLCLQYYSILSVNMKKVREITSAMGCFILNFLRRYQEHAASLASSHGNFRLLLTGGSKYHQYPILYVHHLGPRRVS